VAVRGFRDALEVRHESRQTLEAAPEAEHIGNRHFEADGLAHPHAVLTAERALCVAALEQRIHDAWPASGHAAIQQRRRRRGKTDAGHGTA